MRIVSRDCVCADIGILTLCIDTQTPLPAVHIMNVAAKLQCI